MHRAPKMRVIVRNLPTSTTKEEIEAEFSRHGKVTDVFLLRDAAGEFRRMCFVGYLEEDAAARAVDYHNGSFFRNHKITCEAAREEEERTDESEERKIKYSKQIFVKDIPEDATEELLRGVFGKHGDVSEIEIMDQKNGRNARVGFASGESAVHAYRDVRTVGGRKVDVCGWKNRAAKKGHEHYNSLFFNFESIIKRTCESEQIDVKDLVNIKDKDLGARIALIETHLVRQTKEFLQSSGIHMDALTGEVDKKTLIVRNMDLMNCLDLVKGECRISVAPSKCLALLRFQGEKEALECYRRLNLRRVKEHVIYCEYAPVCSVPETREPEAPERLRGESNKLLVKNVPFQASEDEIRKIFDPFVHVVGVRIPVKREGASRGFCFVTLGSAADVAAAIEHFGSSTHLYGRRLVLERAKS